MADISKEIEALENAKYGKEVRGALVSLAKKNNEVSESTEESEKRRAAAEKNRVEEEQKRNSAEETRQTNTGAAINRCNTATDRANKAAQVVEDAIEGKGFVTEGEKGEAGGVASLDSTGKVPSEQMADIGKLATLFNQASARDNLKSGEKLNEILGKIMKWFADLKPYAFAAPVNNLTGTNPDLALAATQGKEIKKQIDALNSALINKIIHGKYKDVNLMVLNPDVTFSNGTANVRVLDFSEIIGKTMINAVAQLKEASTAVITSCRVLNSTTIQIKCANISGTGFDGKIALTIFAFVV